MNEPESSPNTSLTSMTLQEARAVLWLRNNHRPMGELLDEGYLDTRRLEWAAEKAYDPRIKQAAGVLLDGLRRRAQPAPTAPDADHTPPPLEVGMTIEQARATRWPFQRFKGQLMGPLVDAQQLSLKDLLFAVENAWDERVRRAATVLLTLRLNHVVREPPPAAGPLKVLSSGRSFSERRQFQWTFILGALFGALGVLWMLGVAQVVRWVASGPSGPDIEAPLSPVGVAIVLVILIALATPVVWLINRLIDLVFKRVEARIENYQKGQAGEDRVVEALRQNLDGRWTLWRNVTLPGRNKADIDAVLVGPPGVWVLEIKTFTGEYRNVGEHWEFRSGNRWSLLKSSPSRQAQDNAARLASFLKADRITQWIAPVVVWANPESPLTVENPMVAAWTFDRLPEELGNIWQGQKVEEATQARIVEKLAALCRERDEEAS